MAPSKCLLLLLDGLGDRQYPELDGLTPLQAAYTPNLDHLAEAGGNGLYHPGCLGEPFPSENAHFALFGYPDELFPGRGPVEALGAGMELKQGEVAVLAHFVSARTREGALFVERDRPGPADPKEVRALFELVGSFEHQGVTVRLHQTRGLFGVLTLQGEVSPLITDSNPMQDLAFATEVAPTVEGRIDPGAQRCAEALQAYLAWAYQRLSASKLSSDRKKAGMAPINALVTQRAGRMSEVEPFSSRTGLTGALIARGALYRGLGRLLGMDVLDVPEGLEAQADFSARLELSRAHLPEFDFLHLHTKAPDEAAHTKSFLAKREAIEALDRSLEQHMNILACDPDILTVVASDHSTPSRGSMIHSGEPVPVIMRGATVRRDRVAVYDEIEAGSGSLGLMRGPELMRMVLNLMDRARMRGIQNSPQDLLYWPGPASALKV